MTDKTVNVDLGARSYVIDIHSGSMKDLQGKLDRYVGAEKYFIITDKNVGALYLSQLEKSLSSPYEVYQIDPGEASKKIETYNNICTYIIQNGVTRKAAVIALGGGVVGDLAGFVAATILRGIKYVQIPTSLLAQVDSSVGGKTGINSPLGKNLIGSFYQPSLVYTDITTLKTLPQRHILAGYAEILKYALIDDTGFFEWLDEHAGGLLAGDPDVLSEAIAVSCRKKADVVARDEQEGNIRALLNLGHTFGHALEAIAGYDDSLLHGEAVMIGMNMALAYSVDRGYAPEGDLEKLRKHYKRHDLWPKWNKTYSADDMLTHMQKDKKNIKDRIVLILMRGIGKSFIAKDENAADIKDFLARYIKGR